MPRKPSIEIPGGFFHITARAVARMTLYHDEWDYAAWLTMLERTVEAFTWRCYAYCAMPNHFHLVIETPEPTRSAGMRHLNGSYAQRYNARYDGSGHVFQGRYDAKPIVEDAHLLECCRYVVLNPVRARICKRPEDWRWSSYRATVGIVPAPKFPSFDDVLGLFIAPNDRKRSAYARFVADGIAESGHVQGPGPETRLRHVSPPLARALSPAPALRSSGRCATRTSPRS